MNEKLIKDIEDILSRYELCDHCLARLFENIPEDTENKKLEFIKENITNNSKNCAICNNILDNEDKIVELILEKINMLNIQFNNFVIACQINNKQIKENQEKIQNEINYEGNDDLKRQIKRDIGIAISEQLEKEVDFKNPEVVILIKLKDKPYKDAKYPEINLINIFLDSNPLFIEGRYRKLVRGIPQTKWPCTKCKGKGCPDCNYTGKQYEYTVEDLIAAQLVPLTNGNGVKFHGSGREDIDVRMLGEGRPFVIEVKHPFIRNIDLKELENLVNTNSNSMIEIKDLKFVSKNRRAEVKKSSTSSYKVYSAIADFDKGVTSNDIEKIEKLSWIDQRTPNRVSHRRSDLVRRRLVKKINVERINSKQLRINIKCQGGLYIKELISGDEGRTNPSVATLTNKKAICSQLDVLEVHLDE